MTKVKCDWVHKYLFAAFRILGGNVARHPLLFFFIPVLCVAILAGGISKIQTNSNNEVESLYCPINGRSRTEKMAVECLFPTNHSDINFLRETKMTRLTVTMIEPIDRGSALRENIMDYLQLVDDTVQSVAIRWKNQTLRYRDICPKTALGECLKNEILSFRGKMKATKEKKNRIKYPVDYEIVSSFRFSVFSMGGVTVDDDGYIEDAKALRLIYLLEYSTPEMNEISVQWENELVKVLAQLRSDYAYVFYFVGSMFNSEFHRVTEMVLPLSFIAGPLILGFAVLTCLTRDWVRSKPWIGVAGCLSSCLGVIGAFGLLLFCGAEYVDLNIALPFLLTGVGLDDSFVLLAAWRRTDPKDSVEKRMAECYSEAAVSVTITSLTNFLSFCIGLTTPYRVVRIFSLYAAISIVFSYICQLTFFGGALALTGFREESGRHSVLCIKVRPENTQKYTVLKFLYFGLDVKEDGNMQNRSSFYREILGGALTKPLIKAVVLATFIVYLAVSIYSLKYLKQGFDYVKGFPYDSYAVNASLKHYEYFVHYPHPISIVVNATLDYSNPHVQKDIEDIIAAFVTAPNMAGYEVMDSWLKYFVDSINDNRFWLSYQGYNMSDSKEFIHALQNVFLKIPSFHRFNQDILFNENGTEIIATRYIISSKDILDAEMERKLLLALWNIADSCKYQVYVHNFWFIIYNQHTDIMSSSIQALCVAVVAITLVFILFIPNMVCAVCVGITIVSVQTGVIGYMSLWGVSLDTVSMINLLVSAGFSVDYAAHVSYAYVTCKNTNPDEKVKTALEAAGHPIVQGCLSTILGVTALWFGPSYAFVIVFKIVLLVMLFAGAHGLFLLPVILRTWDSVWLKCRRTDTRNKSQSRSNNTLEITSLINKPGVIDNQNKLLKSGKLNIA